MKTSIALLLPFGVFVLVGCMACTAASGDGDVGAPSDDASPDASPIDARPDAGHADATPSDTRSTDTLASETTSDGALVADDAEIVGATFPDSIGCGVAQSATVVVRSTGSATWTRASQYKLGRVGDADPLVAGDPRVWLADGDSVPPGATHTFDVSLVGPASAGAYPTSWQMVHEGIRWFGGTTSHTVNVTCSTTTDAGVDTTSPPDTTPTFPDAAGVTIDLSTVTVLNSPADVASWPETAKITTLDLGPTGVYVDFTKRDGAGSWPDVPFGAPGDSLEYTLWIVIQVEGKWYTSGCIQFWHGLDRNGGPPSGYAANWYYDAIRWAPMTGHQPLPGEPVGFFVTAGNERNVTDDSCCAVKERSNLVVIPFPSTDSGTVFTY